MLPLAQVTEWREARKGKDTVVIAMEDNDIQEALAAGAGYGQEKRRQRCPGL